MEKLTWEDLANAYDKANSGRRARTLPMDIVFDWAKAQKDKFFVDEEGYIYNKEDK